MIYILDREENNLLFTEDGEPWTFEDSETAFNSLKEYGYNMNDINKNFMFLRSFKLLEVENIELPESSKETAEKVDWELIANNGIRYLNEHHHPHSTIIITPTSAEVVKKSETMENKTGIELIAEERQRQIDVEGWTPEHDVEHNRGELAAAGAAYAMAELYRRTTSKGYDNTPHSWPFSIDWWKPSPDDRIKELVKAGALIAAEIDRLQNTNNGK